MHSVLIDLGWFQIRSYGFLLAVSFLAGIYLAAYRAKRYGVQPQLILDLSIYIIIGAVVGSRLLYVLFHLGDYSSPLEIFALWQGGATFYGGLILAVVLSYIFISRKKLSFMQVADITAPSIALGVVFTRVGCFLSGCCYGKPTLSSWGVHFPHGSEAADSAAEAARQLGIATIGLHPSQLYSSAYGLLIFVIVLAAEKYLRKPGAAFGALLVAYGAARFSVDFFRFYEANTKMPLGLTVSQLISLGLLVLGLVVLLRKRDGVPRAGG